VADQLPADPNQDIQDLVNALLAKAIGVTHAVHAVTTAHANAVAHRDYLAATRYAQAKHHLEHSREQLLDCADHLQRTATSTPGHDRRN